MIWYPIAMADGNTKPWRFETPCWRLSISNCWSPPGLPQAMGSPWYEQPKTWMVRSSIHVEFHPAFWRRKLQKIMWRLSSWRECFDLGITNPGWWFGTCFFHILGIIIPTDSYFSERCGNHQPESKGCASTQWFISARGGHKEKNPISSPTPNTGMKVTETGIDHLDLWGPPSINC